MSSMTEGVVVTLTDEIVCRMLRTRGIPSCVACDVVFGAVADGWVTRDGITSEQYTLLLMTAIAVNNERGCSCGAVKLCAERTA